MTQIQQIKHRQSMDYWKQVILAQQQSGLKDREYCRQQMKHNSQSSQAMLMQTLGYVKDVFMNDNL